MRAETKRIFNQPMKSPSPDIANRSIIKDTKIPIDDINRYLEKAHDRSPKASIKFSGVDQAMLQNLKEKINILQTRNAELKAENEFLKKKFAKQQPPRENSLTGMGEIIKSEYTSRNISPKNTVEDTQLHQMQKRLLNFVNQNERLANMLFEKQNLIKKLNQDNEQLRRIASSAYRPSLDQSAHSEVRNYYEDSIQPQMRNSESIWAERMRQLNEKIENLQNAQKYIEGQVSKRNSLTTPQKYSQQRPTIGSSKSPNNLSTHSSKKQYEAAIARLQKENQYLSKKCIGLQFQLQSLKDKKGGNGSEFNPLVNDDSRSLMNRSRVSVKSSRDRSNTQTQKFLQDKIRELEVQLEKKINKISDLEEQLKHKDNGIALLKQKHEREKQVLEKQKTNTKQQLDDERKANEELQGKVFKFEEDLGSNEGQLEAQIKKNKQIQTFYQNKLNQLKAQYEDKLESKEKQINEQMSKYLDLLHQIRRDIEQTDGEFRMSTVRETVSLGQGTDDIGQKINTIQQQNLNMIQNLKKQLIAKQQSILQLQHQNKLQSSEITLLKQQIQKIKEIMSQNQEFAKALKEKAGTIERQEQNCKLKVCLKQTMKKINMLESQIGEMLK